LSNSIPPAHLKRSKQPTILSEQRQQSPVLPLLLEQRAPQLRQQVRQEQRVLRGPPLAPPAQPGQRGQQGVLQPVAGLVRVAAAGQPRAAELR
jgi:hypothetical protein